MFFYEDYPYVERIENLWRALNLPISGQWLRLPQMLEPVHAQAKIAAIAHYASQNTVLFNKDMPARVGAQLTLTGAPGLAEILWKNIPVASALDNQRRNG